MTIKDVLQRSIYGKLPEVLYKNEKGIITQVEQDFTRPDFNSVSVYIPKKDKYFMFYENVGFLNQKNMNELKFL